MSPPPDGASTQATRPRTRLLPPLPFAAALLAGWWLRDHLWALPLPRAGVRAGWALVLLGVALLTWAARTLYRHRTTINPFKGASSLCTDGPFAFSRNPIYLADSLMLLGGALVLRTLWPLVFAPFILWTIWHFVLRHEEAHLRARFGSAYDDYTRRVRRWI